MVPWSTENNKQRTLSSRGSLLLVVDYDVLFLSQCVNLL
uniref:Uncharacterized protein n=1 Tax=Rhizophora mucronata TaxID=61149 RepID=A0A2P2Q8I2_RHIMU